MAGRKPKITKALIPIESSVIEPEDYLDYSSTLIQLGVLMLEKSLRDDKKLLGEGVVEPAIELMSEQVQYLNMRMKGIRIADCCKALKIDISAPMLWEEQYDKNSVYAYCIDIIRKSQALMLEDTVWNDAINNDSKDLLKMFALKSRMPEYKDNAVGGGQGVVIVNLKVDNQPYSVDENTVTVIEGEEV
jgi:hypothetical protein